MVQRDMSLYDVGYSLSYLHTGVLHSQDARLVPA